MSRSNTSRLKINTRRRNGSAIVELTASMLVVIPLVITILFVVLEMTTAYLIHTVLCQSAHQAARDLAIAYPDDQAVAISRVAQNVIAYDTLRYSGIIANSAQFDDAVFDTTSDPPTVTVTVHYTSDQYGLRRFPTGVLSFVPNFQLSGKSTYRMEGN